MIILHLESNPGHKGRPGQRGGSAKRIEDIPPMIWGSQVKMGLAYGVSPDGRVGVGHPEAGLISHYHIANELGVKDESHLLARGFLGEYRGLKILTVYSEKEGGFSQKNKITSVFNHYDDILDMLGVKGAVPVYMGSGYDAEGPLRRVPIS